MSSRTLMQRLFEPRSIRDMAPGTKVIVYGILLFWTAFVLFPIYWVFITSFKTATDVNAGPVYLPFIDFQPSLHAWKELFVFDYEDTLRAYFNSLVIALSSTAASVLIGSMAAYALARFEYKPRFGTVLMFVLVMICAF
ncbi:MAG: carbohydrate ABC transporter permease, partial [Pseudomonadota bacterium]